MAGEGSMLHAIKSLAYNKSLRNKHNRASWKDYKTPQDKPLIDPIKASPELLAAIKTRLQAENKKRKKHQFVLMLLIILCLLVVFYYLNYSISGFPIS
jgi:small neutral amino acid transporter SnatA (MarC family)